MISRKSLWFKTLSTVMLLLSLWSFGGIGEALVYASENNKLTKENNRQKKKRRSKKHFKNTLKEIERTLQEIEQGGGKRLKSAKKLRLKQKRDEIDFHDQEIKTKLASIKQKLIQKGLPEKILNRHNRVVLKHNTDMEELKSNLESIINSKTKEDEKGWIKKARIHLKKIKHSKKGKKLRPDNLPFKNAQPTNRKPRTMPKGLTDSFNEPILLAYNGSLSKLLVDKSTDLFVPQPSENLAENPEVQFTEAITTLASQLGTDPLKIYEWVRNNIDYTPTFGSIQGASMCLQTKECNSFDTSSLLISLLRVSGISARYAYGIVEMPIEEVKNWMGGFTSAESLISFISAAGIPVQGITEQGGEISKIQLEHIWVRGYIDYFPSRGARHKNEGADTWISLDASYKGYIRERKIDLQGLIPFDSESFVNQLQSSSTINEQDSHVSGVQCGPINGILGAYKANIDNHLSFYHPQSTVGDMVTKKEIVSKNHSFLRGVSYKINQIQEELSELPHRLRHKLSFNLSKGGAPSFEVTRFLSDVAGKKITLSYRPATQADRDVINSYMPVPSQGGSVVDPSELPMSLPAYLVHVIPELRIDGEVVASGTEIMLGTGQTLTTSFTFPNKGDEIVIEEITAGEYKGIAIDTGKISTEQITSQKEKLNEIKRKVENDELTGLTNDDILGEILFTGALTYFAELDTMEKVESSNLNLQNIRHPSEAILTAKLKVTEEINGIPFTVVTSGLALSAEKKINNIKSLKGEKVNRIQGLVSSGMSSSVLTHLIPEELFKGGDVQGVSAIKALQETKSTTKKCLPQPST